MGPLDKSLGAKQISAHDISASMWEGSGADKRTDASGNHGAEGSAKDRTADKASRSAINARINGNRK